MKNHLKFTLAIALICLLGIGCKKNLVAPPTSQANHLGNSRNQEQTSKTARSTFKAAKEDTKISIMNTPSNTKQFVGIMDVVSKPTKTPKHKAKVADSETKAPSASIKTPGSSTNTEIPIWVFVASRAAHHIDAQPSSIFHGKTPAAGDMEKGSSIIDFRERQTPNALKSSKTEIFALDRELTPEELANLDNMSRNEFRAYCQNTSNNLNILNSTMVHDIGKVIKDIERDIVKIEGNITRKEARKQDIHLSKRDRAILDVDISAFKQELADRQYELNNLRNKSKPADAI